MEVTHKNCIENVEPSLDKTESLRSFLPPLKQIRNLSIHESMHICFANDLPGFSFSSDSEYEWDAAPKQDGHHIALASTAWRSTNQSLVSDC
jgi:hypothetical protein